MKTCICITLFMTLFIKNSMTKQWTLPDRLFEICPFTSFCEDNASKPFRYLPKYTPCCSPCSCSDDCGFFKNCCHRDLDRYNMNTNENITTVCRSTEVSQSSVNIVRYYKMIDTCSGDQNHTGNVTRFENNAFKSLFHPVYSPGNEMIYINAECAKCNNVIDGIKWQQAITCKSMEDSMFFDDAEKVIQDNDLNTVGSNCVIFFHPPKGVDLTTFKCKPEIIRSCNVSGNIKLRDESWNFCTAFNATFRQPGTSTRFGNIFCYLCNSNDYYRDFCIDENFGDDDHKFNMVSFTVVLDTTEIETQIIPTGSSSQCPPSELFVKSFKSSCRPRRCPLGQKLVNGSCSYYSTLWYGTLFSVVLKLTPINIETIPGAFFSKMRKDDKINTLAPWLHRGILQDWYVNPFIQTSEDLKAVRYIIANVTYPLSYANPSYLHDVIQQALTETWFLKYEKQEYPLFVKFNEIIKYSPTPTDVLGISTDINKTILFLAEHLLYNRQLVTSADYLFPLYQTKWIHTGMILTKLFFCEQVDLFPDEYVFSELKVYFRVANKTIYDAEYRFVNSYHQNQPQDSGTPVETVRICADEFEMPNDGYLPSSCVNIHSFLVFLIIFLFKLRLPLLN